ncbi:hypothetical protein G2912_06615 [Paraburkholderia aspalathi]|nr:hypothetical protein [Paraburkholderia aspalathi]
MIEAATEDVQIKRDIIKRLDSVVGPATIIATNTSSVSVTMPGASLSNPARLTGLHFFNPVPVRHCPLCRQEAGADRVTRTGQEQYSRCGIPDCVTAARDAQG